MSNRITSLPTCPTLLVHLAETSTPVLREPEYSRELTKLVDLAERFGSDDVETADSLVRDVIIAWQDAAIRQLEGEDE